MGSNSELVAHILHSTDTTTGNVSYVTNGFRAVTGLQAYRNYEWMTDGISLNSVGNLRGMVISARWATTYQVISKAADYVGTAATVASIASNAMELAPQFESVYNSNDSQAIKTLKFTSLAGTVAQRTLIGVITGGVHLIYLPLIVGCSSAAKIGKGGKMTDAANVCLNVVETADSLVKQSANYITDPVNQQSWIQYFYTIQID
jgi:hypothetical protein